MVRSFPRWLSAAVLACYFLAKLLPSTKIVREKDAYGKWRTTKSKQIPAAKGKRPSKKKAPQRCWEFFSVSCLAKELCWTYQRTERALNRLDEMEPKVFLIDWANMSVAVAPLALLDFKDQASQDEHRKVRKATLSRMESFGESEAKYQLGLEALPELVALITREKGGKVTRLYGMDSNRCGRCLAAALLLGQLRGKVLYHRRKKHLGQSEPYTRSDEQLSADTGLSMDQVKQARNQLKKLKLIQVEKLRARGLDWLINGYTLLRKR
jgi:hypothetical protein